MSSENILRSPMSQEPLCGPSAPKLYPPIPEDNITMQEDYRKQLWRLSKRTSGWNFPSQELWK